MSPVLISYSYDSTSQLTYYHQVLRERKVSSVEVQLDVNGKGKGLVAIRTIAEGDTVFVERPLVNLQHLDNHGSAIVCQACLRFVGSVEDQIGHKLRYLVDSLRGAQQRSAHPDSGGSDHDGEEEDVNLDEALEAGERLEQIYTHVTPERIAELCSGTTKLPMSDDFQLPHPVPCRRGCGALYCGATCEEAAWEHSHCLLCTGHPSVALPPATATDQPAALPSAPAPAADETSPAPGGSISPTSTDVLPDAAPATPSSSVAQAKTSETSEGTAAAAAGSSMAAAPPPPPPAAQVDELYGIRVDRRALSAFRGHARQTNEIFLLAAQVVAATLLRAARRLAEGGSPSAEGEAEENPEVTARAAEAAAAGPSGSQGGGAAAAACRSALLAAWRPYMYAWKRCWWESVAAPDDVDDEEEFRSQLRSLASDSLELLSAAISDPRFGPELVQLEVYGSIVGMFELNNMGLTVPSPVEDYFLAVDELEEGAEERGIFQVTQPLLDALDTEYASGCEATAFLALQSCVNHSCDPNCTAGCDDGDATVTVVAQRDIAAGEEITLSYIDVSLPYKERQAELRDYGFVCRCARCVSEAAAARAKRQGAARGVKVGGGRRR